MIRIQGRSFVMIRIQGNQLRYHVLVLLNRVFTVNAGGEHMSNIFTQLQRF